MAEISRSSRFTPGRSPFQTYASTVSVTSNRGFQPTRARVGIATIGAISLNGSQRSISRIIRIGSHSAIVASGFLMISLIEPSS